MDFTSSAKNIELVDGHILRAEVKDEDGNWVNSEIDLNMHVGNDDGWFTWDGQNFSLSAENIQLDGSVLTAELTKDDGGYRERQAIDLDDQIGNEGGELYYESLQRPC